MPPRVDGECTTATRANRPPPSAGVLARYARAFAADLGVSEGRVRAWIAYMVLAGLLERSEASAEGYRFTVKGGVALELRLRNRARATKDIDLVLHHADADLTRAVERAVTTVGVGNQGFQFRRKGEPLYLENRTISVEFAVTYEGGRGRALSSTSRAQNRAKAKSNWCRPFRFARPPG